MKEIEKSLDIELAYYEGKDTYEKFLAFLEDLGNYADYNWDIPKMQYDLVKSDKEWKEFLSHPERQPYKLKVAEWHDLSVEEIYQNVLSITKLTVFEIKKTKKDEVKEALKKPLAQIIRGILHSRYLLERMRTVDQYAGITDKMRGEGDMYVTQVAQANFDFATSVVALQLDKSVEYIRNRLLTISQGDISRINEYFNTCQFDDELKEIYQSYAMIRSADSTVEYYSTILAYKIWRELYEAGVDLETFLYIMDYDTVKNVKARLQKFLSDKEIIKEALAHFKAERPKSYKKYQKQGWINMIDTWQEEAEIRNYPTTLRTQAETQEMVDDSLDVMREYFPISQIESPRRIYFAPIHPFANKRAYQSHTYNSEGQSVDIVVMTPSVETPEEFLETLAHETTHAIHSIILKLGAEYGVLTKKQADHVPAAILEEFSQLVEGQFKKRDVAEGEKKLVGKQFASFSQMIGSRWQAPYALIQLEVRERFEELIKKGVKVLTADTLRDLQTEFDVKVQNWWETGIRLHRPGLSALSWFSPLSPDDGLVYLKVVVTGEKKSKRSTSTGKVAPKQLSVKEAFVKRFGAEWIKLQDARILLYWLLLETGRNHEVESYSNLVLTKNVVECLEELQKISIDASEFKPISE